MGESWFLQVLREPVTPGYIALLFLVGICLRYGSGIMGAFNERLRDRAKITSEDWERLVTEIKRLAEECAHLREKVNECEDDRLAWMGRAIAAEAKLQGEGDVRQAQAVAQAEVRLDAIDKARRGKGKNDG